MDTSSKAAVLRASELVGGKAALARLTGVKPQTVQQWANGERPVAPVRCVLIEQATKGEITRRDLRPSDWAAHWPELTAPGHPSTEQATA
ncbi:hypothetical protein D7S86_08285 [Pararobbsia silviterrae]|uniref:Helix-turn-helix domain-containing protein n=2 Tax=Pararobbsia silviterrae TaxID=1792498 RepID=A0A494Y0T2_9BURK|nr:YdaS family helix-turn-helix protein [Pararobbsia silviterrae]RKP56385.1 hypothetical protein D7S86_08285 [Pararobbsia silviterrae]